MADVAGAALQADVFAPGARQKALERDVAFHGGLPTAAHAFASGLDALGKSRFHLDLPDCL